MTKQCAGSEPVFLLYVVIGGAGLTALLLAMLPFWILPLVLGRREPANMTDAPNQRSC